MPKWRAKSFIIKKSTPKVVVDKLIKTLTPQELAELLTDTVFPLQTAFSRAQLLSKYIYHLRTDYDDKDNVRTALESVYTLLTSDTLTLDAKYSIGTKLTEGIELCTDGILTSCKSVLSLQNTPQNLDELLTELRTEIVEKVTRVSGRLGYVNNEIHTHNQIFTIAAPLWGVAHITDRYASNLTKDQTIARLTEAFEAEYSLFGMLSGLEEHIKSALTTLGYVGKIQVDYEGYPLGKFNLFIDFVNLILKPKQIEIAEIAILGNDDLMKDINWPVVKQKLYEKLVTEGYVTCTTTEDMLLTVFFNAALSIDDFKELLSIGESELSTLFSSPGVVVACLTCYQEWPTQKKQALIDYYLKLQQTPQKINNAVLGMINNLRDEQTSVTDLAPLNRDIEDSSRELTTDTKTMAETNVPIISLLPISYDIAFFTSLNAEGDTPIRRAIKQGSIKKLTLLLGELSKLPTPQQAQVLMSSVGLDAANDLNFAAEHYPYAVKPLIEIIHTLDDATQATIWTRTIRYRHNVLMQQIDPTDFDRLLTVINTKPKELLFTLLLQQTRGYEEKSFNGQNALIIAGLRNEESKIKTMIEAMNRLDSKQQETIWKQTSVYLSKYSITAKFIMSFIKAMEPTDINYIAYFLSRVRLTSEVTSDEMNEISNELIKLSIKIIKSMLVDKFATLNSNDPQQKYQKAYDAANELYASLRRDYTAYLTTPADQKAATLKTLQDNWLSGSKKCSIELRHHRNISGKILEIITNLILLCSGVGTLYWLGRKGYDLYAGHGLFHPITKTKSAVVLDDVSDISNLIKGLRK